MILLYNFFYITLITFAGLFITNKLLNVKNTEFKITSFILIITIMIINDVFYDLSNKDYSENYLLIIVILISVSGIIILLKMFSKKNSELINQKDNLNIKSIKLLNANYELNKINKNLENENFISKEDDNFKVFEAIINQEKIEFKIKWIDPNPNNKKENNLSTLTFFLIKTFSFNNMKPIDIYNNIFLEYFDLGNERITEFDTFKNTYHKVNSMKVSELNNNYLKISEILKIDK